MSSTEEIRLVSDSGDHTVNKTIVHLLLHTVVDSLDTKVDTSLQDDIKSLLKYDTCHMIECNLDTDQYNLCLALRLVKSDYIPKFIVTAKDDLGRVAKGIEILKHISVGHWDYLCHYHDDLIKRISDAVPGVDFSKLSFDASNLTFYFNPNCELRAGIVPVYHKGNRIFTAEEL